jgi:hypothetical protein
MNIPYLAQLNGQPIILPEDSRAKPSSQALQHRKDRIYGLFLLK